jgi:D-alanine-D-alanine ligase
MNKKIHVAIVFNEPTITTAGGRKYISESGRIQVSATKTEVLQSTQQEQVDLSEVGVLEERESVQKALQAAGYRCSLFNMNGEIQRLFDFLDDKKPDVIFNLCESVGNESAHEMHVAGLYELMGVPYTGASAFVLGSCLSKVRTKEVLRSYGMPVPRFQVFRNVTALSADDLEISFPAIVKPSQEDASVGIESDSVVDNLAALKRKVRRIFQMYDQPALVEEYVDGRELNVAIIGNKRPIALPISEIDFSKLPSEMPKIVTYRAKWVHGSVEYEGTVGVCPAPLAPETEKQVRDLALKAYRVMGCRDYARIDMRLDRKNNPYVIEVNPNPDISDDAGFARSARAYGLTFDQIVAKIVEYALERMP